MRRVAEPADSVVLRPSREQFELAREAVDEYIYELEYNTLPPRAHEIGRGGVAAALLGG